MNNQELGKLGERLTCEYLVNNGYNILGINHRITFGEIDIIARKKWRLFGKNDKTIHFVEVKTILGEKDFYPEDRVNDKKQKKLRQLALIWLQKQGFSQDYPYQIDVAGITVNSKTNMARLFYFFNAVGD